MRNKIQSVSLISIALLTAMQSVYAAPKKITDGELQEALKQSEQSQTLAPKNSPSKSAKGGAEITAGTVSDGSMPDELYLNKNFSTAAYSSSCVSTWWLSGSHNWKWKSYWAYLKIELNGSSWTRYGTSSGPCEIPLTVNRIDVIGDTKASINTATGKARINNSGFETNRIDASGSDKIYGINLTKGPCGAVVLHRAYHLGISWSNISKSGCGGNPGTI